MHNGLQPSACADLLLLGLMCYEFLSMRRIFVQLYGNRLQKLSNLVTIFSYAGAVRLLRFTSLSYRPLAWTGVALMLAGVALHAAAYWSKRHLEKSALPQSGPYRWVRHPDYLASLTMWAGAGLAGGRLEVAILIFIVIGAGFVYRLEMEERALVRKLGSEYTGYCRRTFRIIPFLF